MISRNFGIFLLLAEIHAPLLRTKKEAFCKFTSMRGAIDSGEFKFFRFTKFPNLAIKNSKKFK